MNDHQNELEQEPVRVHYSRSNRRVDIIEPMKSDDEGLSNDEELSQVEEEILEVVKINWPHYIAYAIMSVLVSLSTIVLPYLDEFANGIQLQHLYTGFGMANGQMPYSSVFATGGFLYYTLIAILAHFHLEWGLVLVQCLSLFLSGVYFEKLLIRLTNKTGLGQSFTLIFYMLQLALGFGGLYPIQWGMPFVLMGLYYLSNYFVGKAKDEIFIAYGLVAGISILFDPKTLVFWIWALVLLVIYNMSHKRFARGFYHFLSICFGLVLVFYTALYFILNFQILSPMVSQTLLYPILVPGFEVKAILISIGVQLGALLLSGLLTGIVLSYKLIKEECFQKFSYWLLVLSTLSYLILAVLSQTFWLYPLLYVLPFSLLLVGIWAVKAQEDLRRPKVAKAFLKQHLFIPAVVIIVAIAYPIGMSFLARSANQERNQIATYLQEHTQKKDKIYVWDDTACIYLKANRYAASQLPSPVLYTNNKENAKLLEDELLQHRATYLVVNQSIPLSDTLEKDLSKHYKPVSLDGVEIFKVYQAK